MNKPWPTLVEGQYIKRGNVASEAYKHSAVSYTHLDVYKRQLIGNLKSFALS